MLPFRVGRQPVAAPREVVGERPHLEHHRIGIAPLLAGDAFLLAEPKAELNKIEPDTPVADTDKPVPDDTVTLPVKDDKSILLLTLVTVTPVNADNNVCLLALIVVDVVE